MSGESGQGTQNYYLTETSKGFRLPLGLTLAMLKSPISARSSLSVTAVLRSRAVWTSLSCPTKGSLKPYEVSIFENYSFFP
jgi:hypothetical protein